MLRADLDEESAFRGLGVEHRAVDESGTEKFILEVPGEGAARRIEAVWIAAEPRDEGAQDGRRTVCISCQAGCTLDCTFCATGTLPFQGNLSAAEIVDQVYLLEVLRNQRASNVVFMGMGEPFHNYEAVLAAAHLLHHPAGAGLSARRITISTAGVVTGIERFTDDGQPFNLAISLNHPDPHERVGIMPHDHRYPLEDLLGAARRYTQESGRRVTFEYVMISGVNMEPRHAGQLIEITRSMRSKVNLIPLNTDVAGMRRPSAQEAARFQARLVDAGVHAFNRGSPGREVGGACGMLALDRALA